MNDSEKSRKDTILTVLVIIVMIIILAKLVGAITPHGGQRTHPDSLDNVIPQF